jgi:hypothetical protein
MHEEEWRDRLYLEASRTGSSIQSVDNINRKFEHDKARSLSQIFRTATDREP